MPCMPSVSLDLSARLLDGLERNTSSAPTLRGQSAGQGEGRSGATGSENPSAVLLEPISVVRTVIIVSE